MKTLLILLFCLTGILSFAQKSQVKNQSSAASAKEVLSVAMPPDTLPNMPFTELKYYKSMYEQAKAEADRAHNDVMVGYQVNIGTILVVVFVIIGIQYINVRAELKKTKKLILNTTDNIKQDLNSIRDRVASLEKVIPETLSTFNSELKATEERLHQLIKREISNSRSLYRSGTWTSGAWNQGVSYSATPEEVLSIRERSNQIRVAIDSIRTRTLDTIEFKDKIKYIIELANNEVESYVYDLMVLVFEIINLDYSQEIELKDKLEIKMKSLKRFTLAANSISGAGSKTYID